MIDTRKTINTQHQKQVREGAKMASAEKIAKYISKVTPEDVAAYKREYYRKYRAAHKAEEKARKEAYYVRKVAERLANEAEAKEQEKQQKRAAI